ncbi:hypothetical protein EVAR_103360_1 [Eumeta japonica]|uniref:Uncharacterized protein n=1 Tax=Eumeta variegata TaxID=151549 RepID=A0A4C1YAI5_EUMVA|nr:hypothetical protein EVAR_103360_1 [Eumeta japonica]
MSLIDVATSNGKPRSVHSSATVKLRVFVPCAHSGLLHRLHAEPAPNFCAYGALPQNHASNTDHFLGHEIVCFGIYALDAGGHQQRRRGPARPVRLSRLDAHCRRATSAVRRPLLVLMLDPTIGVGFELVINRIALCDGPGARKWLVFFADRLTICRSGASATPTDVEMIPRSTRSGTEVVLIAWTSSHEISLSSRVNWGRRLRPRFEGRQLVGTTGGLGSTSAAQAR